MVADIKMKNEVPFNTMKNIITKIRYKSPLNFILNIIF